MLADSFAEDRSPKTELSMRSFQNRVPVIIGTIIGDKITITNSNIIYPGGTTKRPVITGATIEYVMNGIRNGVGPVIGIII